MERVCTTDYQADSMTCCGSSTTEWWRFFRFHPPSTAQVLGWEGGRYFGPPISNSHLSKWWAGVKIWACFGKCVKRVRQMSLWDELLWVTLYVSLTLTIVKHFGGQSCRWHVPRSYLPWVQPRVKLGLILSWRR